MSPSPFIVEWTERIARERGGSPCALDVAMGRGRHAVRLARAGFRTFGVDVKLDAVREAIAAGRREGVRVRGWCADLTQHPLPRGRFDLVETFTTAQRALGRPPTSPDHLLESGELRRHFDEFDVMFYEEIGAPDAVARLVARSRSSSKASAGRATLPGCAEPCDWSA